jgi:hypothetical protein
MTEGDVLQHVCKYNVLFETVRTLERYVDNRIETGSFLRSVLENDLLGACEKADHVNQVILWNTVNYIYNELPRTCWGSPEKVSNWLSGRTVVRA